MKLISVKDYAEQHNITSQYVYRQIKEFKLVSTKKGNKTYVIECEKNQPKEIIKEDTTTIQTLQQEIKRLKEINTEINQKKNKVKVKVKVKWSNTPTIIAIILFISLILLSLFSYKQYIQLAKWGVKKDRQYILNHEKYIISETESLLEFKDSNNKSFSLMKIK